ncbi:envelope stress response membrane protein PspB [Novosphingobium sp. Chol11]|uniref:envelope stress response membrane protein PspB n=1 Tax=Novosphingobium sp. Chol11 TaxID=1385763 RepID=UPI0025E59555|nr:envelope stress response membrane protein PspB [Novosphingobium sp. Chol11]
MEEGILVLIPITAILGIFVGLPWIVLHYITRWKTASSLTTGDEALLDELYQLARRLEARMDTVERLVVADHPQFQPARMTSNLADEKDKLRELDRMLAAKGEQSQ